MAGFDITKLDVVAAANKGATVDITHPVTGEVLGIKITVCGSDSDLYRKAMRKILNKRANERKTKPNVEQNEAEALELLVQCTMCWEGMQADGADLPFTVENVRKVYKDFPWVKEQIDFAIADRGMFLGN